MKSLLTVPFYGAPVDTIAKWAEAQWKWAAPSIIWVHTVEQSDVLTDQILAINFEVRDYDYMHNASFWPNYGLGIERMGSGAFSFGNYVTLEAMENRIVGSILSAFCLSLSFDFARCYTMISITIGRVRYPYEAGR